MTVYYYNPMGLAFGDTLTEARAAFLETQYWLARHRRMPLGGMADVGVKIATYVDVPGAIVLRLADPTRVRIHAMGLVTAGTGYFQLYSITAAAAVAGTEKTFTDTSATLQEGSNVDLPAGDYKLQTRISNASYHVIVYGACMVSQ